MKRKFLNIISCFLALFIFVGSFVFCVPSHAWAASSSSTSSSYFTDSLSFNRWLDLEYSNSTNNDFAPVIQYYNNIANSVCPNNIPLCIAGSIDNASVAGGLCDAFYAVDSSTFESLSISSSSDVSFNINADSDKLLHVYYWGRSQVLYSFVSNGTTYVESNSGFRHKFYEISPPPFVDDGLHGVVVGFDLSTEAFVQWLISTGKYQQLPSYIGLSKLSSFIDFYKSWGSSNSLFVIKILDWYSHFNIVAQSLENRNILKSTIDRLYQEYLNTGFKTIETDSSRLPHHRRNIETVTTDDDLTLVTDDANDDIYTSLLRDILRGVISIPGQILDCTNMIISKLDYLNWNVTVSNDGGASSGSDLTPVLNKLDDIIDKLEADTVSVEIDQTTKDDTDDFFDEWNLEFKTALDSKFPIASQLNLFFTDFFERCGIDADSDGEVYQYYNPGVLTASSVSRSAGAASEDDIVSDFLGQFDNSDPAFLDDASFHGVPDLSVSVGGQSVSIIDFRVYAKYREKIHFIISFVIWTLYLLHLYKSLPQIIGQVADVAVNTSDL